MIALLLAFFALGVVICNWELFLMLAIVALCGCAGLVHLPRPARLRGGGLGLCRRGRWPPGGRQQGG